MFIIQIFVEQTSFMFQKYVKGNIILQTLDQVIEDCKESNWTNVEQIEQSIIAFFHSFRTASGENKGGIPKGNTISTEFSFVKNIILEKSLRKLDLSDAIQFPNFAKYFKGYQEKVKDLGLANTKHHPSIPDAVQGKIWNLISDLYKVMKSKDNTSDEFKKLLEKIPHYKKTTTCSFSTGMVFFST